LATAPLMILAGRRKKNKRSREGGDFSVAPKNKTERGRKSPTKRRGRRTENALIRARRLTA